MMTTEFAEAYPEHAKLHDVADESQAIGQFLDTNEQGYVLAEYVELRGHRTGQLVPVGKPITEILAEYFGIDLNALEAEKRQMLNRMAAG